MSDLSDLFEKSRLLIENARNAMGVMVNSVTVYTSFLLGKYLVEEEQRGVTRAQYGARVLDSLSAYLTQEYGRGFSRSNLAGMRKFYLLYRDRDPEIVQSGIGQLGELQKNGIVQSPIGQSSAFQKDFPFRLSWTHYQVLLTIDDDRERSFYETEAIRGGWSVKTLKRQYHSSLYERLALNRKNDSLPELAANGATPYQPRDILKSPYVLEFAGLDDRSSYHENDLESAVLNKLQDFLLEMGKGFLFEKRQRRFTFNDRSFYLDLVLYNRFLRCYVLIDFKVDELTHQDLGQMQMYVNYFDRYERIDGENPTIGILMCKQSDEALVELTLPKDSHIFAREYRLYLPEKELLKDKLQEWLNESEASEPWTDEHKNDREV